jgi:hypothetical protein
MKMHIAPSRLINEVQQEFTGCFPFLRLEFFANRSFAKSGYTLQKMLSPDRKIGDAQVMISDGDIELSETMRVMDLENLLKDQFGLAAQVFRRSGNLWLETTMTDSWTLQQQNNHGKEISTVSAPAPKAEDYDLNRDADH